MRKLSRIILITAIALVSMGNISWEAAIGSESQSSFEQDFQKARHDYLQKDMKSAAAEIRKGVSYLKSEAETADAEGKKVLTKSSQELEKLADDVEKGTVVSVKQIETSFARAYQALAKNSYIKSMESWSRKEIKNTGKSLDEATTYLERGFYWAGQKTEAGTKEVIKKSKDLSQKLEQGMGWASNEVGKGLKNTGNEIEKFGQRISSK